MKYTYTIRDRNHTESGEIPTQNITQKVNIKKILDLLCSDRISVIEAAYILDMSYTVDEIFKLADDYTYHPTSEDVIEAREIEKRTLKHIKKPYDQNK